MNSENEKQIFKVIENQLKEKNPACVPEVYTELEQLGYSHREILAKMVSVLMEESRFMLGTKTAYNEASYSRRLIQMLANERENKEKFQYLANKSNEEILDSIRFNEDFYPESEMLVLLKRQQEVQPILLEIARKDLNNPSFAIENPSYALHLHAIYSLLYFREKDLFTLLLNYLERSGETTEDLIDGFFGDNALEIYSRGITSIYNGDLNRIKNLIKYQKIDLFLRASLVEAFVNLVRLEIVPQLEFVEFMKELFKDKRYNQEPSFNSLALCSCFELGEMFNLEAEYLYKSHLGDETIATLSDLYEYERKDLDSLLIKNPIDEMSQWYWFNEKEQEKRNSWMVPEPQVIKVGRNDPCPCGSGKKYKKCCLNSME